MRIEALPALDPTPPPFLIESASSPMIAFATSCKRMEPLNNRTT
jgi:hypothetical protein